MSLKKIRMETILVPVIIAVLVLAIVAFAIPKIQMREGYVHTVITIEYEDGSTLHADPTKQVFFTVTPLTVTDTSGKTIRSIQAAFFATVDWTGTVTAQANKIDMYVAMDGMVKKQTGVLTAPNVIKATETQMGVYIITAREIETWDAGKHISRKMTFGADITVNLTVDGTTVTKTGATTADINVIVKSAGAITVFNLTTRPSYVY